MSKETQCNDSEKTSTSEKITTFVQNATDTAGDNLDFGLSGVAYIFFFVSIKLFEEKQTLFAIISCLVFLFSLFLKTKIPEGSIMGFLNKKKLTKKDEKFLEIIKNLPSEHKDKLKILEGMEEGQTIITTSRANKKRLIKALKEE